MQNFEGATRYIMGDVQIANVEKKNDKTASMFS